MLYVDHARIPYGRMLMSHLLADTPEELREMARKLEIERHIQYPGTPKEHLDVSESKRAGAIRMGAASVTAASWRRSSGQNAAPTALPANTPVPEGQGNSRPDEGANVAGVTFLPNGETDIHAEQRQPNVSALPRVRPAWRSPVARQSGSGDGWGQ